MNQNNFLQTIKTIATKDTSFDPNSWLINNPLWGHCAVVSLLAQDVFGGEILKGSLKHNQKYCHLHSHFWNKIDEKYVDFTAEQYADISYRDLLGEECLRDTILQHPDTQKRYHLLKERFIEKKT